MSYRYTGWRMFFMLTKWKAEDKLRRHNTRRTISEKGQTSTGRKPRTQSLPISCNKLQEQSDRGKGAKGNPTGCFSCGNHEGEYECPKRRPEAQVHLAQAGEEGNGVEEEDPKTVESETIEEEIEADEGESL